MRLKGSDEVSVDDIVNSIIEKYDEETFMGMITDRMGDYVDDEEAEEFGDVYAAYAELGNGEAEDDVICDVINDIGIELTDDQFVDIMDALSAHYNLD